MSETPDKDETTTTEESHLIVGKYRDTDIVVAPDWYDDTINVGDVANAEFERSD